MGRSGTETKFMSKLIPTGPEGQSEWKAAVCIAYGSGEPIEEAMNLATATVKQIYPGFSPLHEPALLDR
jgi:hypothetical protein